MRLKRYPLLSPASHYRWLLLVLTLLVLLLAVLSNSQRAESQSQPTKRQRLKTPSEQTKKGSPNAVPGEILVRFRPSSKGKELGRQVITEKTGRQIPLSIEAISPAFEIVEGLRVAKVNPADTSYAIEALRARPDVIYAEPNFIRKALVTPNDSRYAQMWGLNNTGQPSTFQGNPGTPGKDIRAEQAWNITTGNRSVVVGVVDSGIDINHEDLHNNIWVNPGEIAGNGIDDDGNGFVDDINGWDFAHNDATVFDYTEPAYPPSASYTGDFEDHGTHVAGTIGATGNNTTGVVGVNWQVSLMSLKFLTGEEGRGTSADLLNALAYAKAMRQLWESSGGTKGANLRVLNNSYGGGGFSQAELDAIRALSDAGILFVVAAGNEGAFNDLFPTYPTNYIAPNLISVAASGGGGSKTSFSNWGEATVNVTAPGEFILSTLPKNTYNFASGTSMAAPHVSGTAALVCALSPSITMQKLRSAVMYSGYVSWGSTGVYQISTGRSVDASKALQTVPTTDVTAPGAVNIVSVHNSDNSPPSYTLGWLAPGDDGNIGQIAAYEVRFSDTSINDANFDLAIPLSGPAPHDAGVPDSVTVKVPWRHASGFIGIRAVDDVGNKGPISSVPVSVSADVGDPYTIAESSAAPISTGGTALGLIADDEFKSISLPFTFKFYNTEFGSVTVSTNGVLYFGFPPFSNDATSSERRLNGGRMIAGLWDDLRTDRRQGDDVYMVQDADRVIFRWQAVTFDTPTGPTETRGENPVSFEIELRYDGTITVRYGDGNQKMFPVVGVSSAWPETYISSSHSSEFNQKDLTNAATVVFARRTPVPRGVLTVASSNPASGVNITVSPNDVSNSGNGTTQFTRTYNPGVTVTLTAPATVGDNKFRLWLRDGQDWSGSVTTNLVMNGNHTMTAVYTTPPVLTVTSSNPDSGVNITVTPNDVNGSGNGTTPFTRSYDLFTGVNLNAPATVGTSSFWKWQVDGVDYVQSQFATVSMNADHTATAIYVTATPTPTPTPVPGATAQPIAFVKPGSSLGSGADIFLTNTDGTNVVNISDTAGDDTRPAWSPDGSRLAYTCLRQPDGSIKPPQRICVRNADGTGFAVLSNTLAEDFGPAWSPDGSQIAFTTFVPGFQTVLSIMNADGTGRFPNLLFPGAADPDWSPDGLSLLFDYGNSIWIYRRITQTGQRLTNETSDSRPHFSPDGSKIVFQSTRDGQSAIYVMNSDGTGQTRLTNNDASDTAPVWSPDGTKILFTSLRDGPMSPALYVMNADGSSQTRVTAGSDGVWRPSPTTPVIFTEEGTANAASFYSVTFIRGPFRILDPHNFSFDGHTRVVLFTSNLGLTSPPIPAASILSVQANGVILQIQNVGPVTGVSGMNGSYIIVRLPDGLPSGNLSLTVTLRGLTSAPAILPIVP